MTLLLWAKCSGEKRIQLIKLKVQGDPDFLKSLSCSLDIFREMVSNAIGDLKDVVAYQDDLIIHGFCKVAHDQSNCFITLLN